MAQAGNRKRGRCNIAKKGLCAESSGGMKTRAALNWGLHGASSIRHESEGSWRGENCPSRAPGSSAHSKTTYPEKEERYEYDHAKGGKTRQSRVTSTGKRAIFSRKKEGSLC